MHSHLLFIIPSLDIGGAQKIGSFVSNICAEKGYEVSVLAIDEGENKLLFNPKIKVFPIRERSEKVKKISKLERVKITRKIKFRVKEINPDAIIVFGTMPEAYLALIGCKIPILGAERGDPHAYPRKTKLLIRYVYNKYKILTFQTTMARDAYGSIAANKSFVIPNPCFLVSNNDFSGKSENRNKCIVSVGRIVKEKGYSDLIDAMIKVHEEKPEYNLIIYGEGPLRHELIDKVNTKCASNYISLPGSISNIEKYILDASLFVLSSKYEGVPNALLEAMALGVPVVACDCSPGGAKFLTKDGIVGGPLIPFGDVKIMSESIIKMISNNKYAESMADKGLYVRKEFAPEKIQEEWIKVIQELLA